MFKIFSVILSYIFGSKYFLLAMALLSAFITSSNIDNHWYGNAFYSGFCSFWMFVIFAIEYWFGVKMRYEKAFVETLEKFAKYLENVKK